MKHDGFRVIARKNGAQVRLYSRPGNDLTDRFPLIVETLANLRSRSSSRGSAEEVCGATDGLHKLTIAELANGMVRTEIAIRWCREILDDLQEPKSVGMQAVVKAIRDLCPARRRFEGPGESLHPRQKARASGALI
jgi:ATP dependent DNA ligase domain